LPPLPTQSPLARPGGMLARDPPDETLGEW